MNIQNFNLNNVYWIKTSFGDLLDVKKIITKDTDMVVICVNKGRGMVPITV